MIVASLAACSAMDVISIATQEAPGDRSLRGPRGRQPARRVPAGPDRGDRDARGLGPDIAEAAIRRCIELSATKYCPVNAMLSAGATVVHHRYAIHSTGDALRRRGRGHRDRPVQRPDIQPLTTRRPARSSPGAHLERPSMPDEALMHTRGAGRRAGGRRSGARRMHQSLIGQRALRWRGARDAGRGTRWPA